MGVGGWFQRSHYEAGDTRMQDGVSCSSWGLGVGGWDLVSAGKAAASAMCFATARAPAPDLAHPAKTLYGPPHPPHVHSPTPCP